MRTTVIAAVFVTLAGCASDPLTDYIATSQAVVDRFCGHCWMSGGWESERHCRGIEGGTSAFGGDLDDAERQCMQSAYAGNEAQLGPVLTCENRARREMLGCVAACRQDPADEVASDCYDIYITASLRCVEGLPSDTLRPIHTCRTS